MGLPLSNDGKPVPSMTAKCLRLIRKGKERCRGKESLNTSFSRSHNEWLKTGLGRNIPCMQSIVKDDPCGSTRDPHRVAYVQQGCSGRRPCILVYNPAYAQVQNEHVWSAGWIDIMTGG